MENLLKSRDKERIGKYLGEIPGFVVNNDGSINDKRMILVLKICYFAAIRMVLDKIEPFIFNNDGSINDERIHRVLFARCTDAIRKIIAYIPAWVVNENGEVDEVRLNYVKTHLQDKSLLRQINAKIEERKEELLNAKEPQTEIPPAVSVERAEPVESARRDVWFGNKYVLLRLDEGAQREGSRKRKEREYTNKEEPSNKKTRFNNDTRKHQSGMFVLPSSNYPEWMDKSDYFKLFYKEEDMSSLPNIYSPAFDF